MNRKICIITGSRAEYGLLSFLMKEINGSHKLTLQIIATGSHLSSEFGLTYKNIEEDGFVINEKIEMLVSSDTSIGVSKSVGLGIIGFADVFEKLKPDIVVILGDRFEIFAAAQAALIARIPLAHLHGGESSEGAIDEAFRHSITKMSHIHFTSTEIYRQRVIQLGEDPSSVFNFGAIAIDGIRKLKLWNREELEKNLGFCFKKKNLLVTFHPVTLEDRTAGSQFQELLKVLSKLSDTFIIFTMPNADTGGRIIREMIKDYLRTHSVNSIAFESLGQLRYFSIMSQVDAVIGNSSSGLIETPSFKIGTINIGDRQKGRIKALSVIDCEPVQISIEIALQHLYSKNFQELLRTVINPYNGDCVAKKIMHVLEEYPLENILKKHFFQPKEM
jgi:GDP/UDP-N,N'-diacetylbacillosamine 2-epimerase (hydrolysing)